ncbi:ECF subfamily RNA polymerase sigma-24 subunit [Streptomyces leeuwenhoekii]|uniref:ECF subfamily RNA polymerase sigma-24 subunit n=1 Tax=Streptomyces leeuwenhoekii TaxID=1437453 RepID=A0ABR5HU64_STRLW|nr:sigma-70 family RNA polymerase sigma factor [Streptomyces leeuwenhoekii]KMS74147.1 ECF subfamily RNA polymerase sigma-24 subunit [Streptomyces leeuwenhoekii]
MSVDERDRSLGDGDGDAEAGGPPHVPAPADDRGATGRAEEDGVLPPSEAELIGWMRSGDDTAYEELFRRHAGAVRRYARTCCRDPHTAEDLTAEVFARMLQAVRGGFGPEHAVRAYLLTSVRRVAAGWTQSAKREQLVDDFAVFAAQAARLSEAPEDAVELGADVRAMHEAEQSLAMRAFRSLPERWQAVLWHTEVEDESPSEVATLFGLDAGGARVLASRAREGLRQAYLQAHVSSALTDDEECARYADRLGSYARGRLRTRAERGLRKHLEECARCRLAAGQIQEVAGGIPALVPVAVIGWFGTAGYGKVAGLLAGGAAAAGGGASGTTPASPGLGAPVKAGVTTGVVAVGAVAAVVLALAGNDTPAEPEPKAAPSPSSPPAQPREQPPTPPQPPPTRIPPPTPAPPPPTPAPTLTPTTPRPTPTPTPTPTPIRTPTPTPTATPTPTPTATPPPAPTTYAWSELPYDADGDGSGPEMRLGESGWLWQRHGLSIAGRQYAHGVTVRGSSSVTIDLNRACSAYDALVGVDDLTAKLGKVHFSVHADGTQLWDSGKIKGSDPAVPVHVDLTGRETVRLVVEPHSPVDNAALADWAESKFTCA